jgi:hypothetical protein
MNLNTDPVLTVNLTLCIVIFALGLYEFSQRRSPVELYVGIAFGLFGVSHLLGILGLSAALTTPLIIIRLAGLPAGHLRPLHGHGGQEKGEIAGVGGCGGGIERVLHK